MVTKVKKADGSESVLDDKGAIVSENPRPDGVVEVEALMSHQSRAGQFCPGPREDSPGGRYFESAVVAMDLVSRGIVKLVDPKDAPEVESKMAEPEKAEVSHPVATHAVQHSKGKK